MRSRHVVNPRRGRYAPAGKSSRGGEEGGGWIKQLVQLVGHSINWQM